MRTIKFRAWDREEKTMIDADSWYFSEEFEPFIDSVEKCMRQFDLMQFTGLQDKNGTEIYEGDIIQWLYPLKSKEEYAKNPYKQVVVQWIKRLAGFNSFNNEEGEVIGNIYQHPDLLKKE